MTILVTNDDGHTDGAEILLEVAKELNKNSFAIVPNKQRSATSVALTLHKPLRLHKLREDFYTLSGTPADIVLFSIYSKKFPKPTLILSGINSGDNCAEGSILSSGTVGACWKAVIEGIPSIAFSIYREPGDWSKKNPWKDRATIKKYVKQIVLELIDKNKPDMFYNVTLPDKLKNAKIIHSKNMQRKRFNATITERKDPNGTPYYWLSGDFRQIESGTSLHEVAVKKNITITPVHLSFKLGLEK